KKMKTTIIKNVLPVGLLAMALAGCATRPPLESAGPPVVNSYTGQDAGVAGAGQQVHMGQGAGQQWWQLLKAPQIDALVRMALDNNQDIAVARANLARSAQEAAAADGGFMPQISANGTVARGYDVATGQLPHQIDGIYRIGPGLSYELPLFGLQQQTAAYGPALVARNAAELDAVRLSVSGNVVLQALDIASFTTQLDALEQMIASDKDSLHVLTQANQAGAAPRLDVLSAQNQLDQDSVQLPVYREKLRHAQIALTILIGKLPAQWQAPDLQLDALTLPATLPVALPSELLRRRPDIVATEASIAAAGAAVGIATSNLYPHINLTASMGGQGLLKGGGSGSFFDLLGGMTAPIFDGGSLKARQQAAQAGYQASLASYRGTVSAAFGQVAEAMYRLQTSSDKQAAQQQSLASASALHELAWQGYRAGKTGYLRVLSGLRAQQQARLAYIEASAQRYVASVTLLLASGAH
ncbi:MAG: hypothetical protein RLZZ237_1414, partial [Pseudomonadota bacterium]